MTLKDRIMKDLQDAMRSGDDMRKQTLRMLRSAVRNAEMARGAALLDLAALDNGDAQARELGDAAWNVYTEVKRLRKAALEHEDAEEPEQASPVRAQIGDMVEQYSTLQDSGVEDVIRKEIKQRRESADLYDKAKRTELAERERQEISILEVYLPQQMGEAEIEAEIRSILAGTEARELSKIMPLAMGRLKGKAEGRLINQVVTRVLAEG